MQFGIGRTEENPRLSVRRKEANVWTAWQGISAETAVSLTAGNKTITGNLGIGTATANTSLEIYNATNPKIFLNSGGATRCYLSGTSSGLDLGNDNGTGKYIRFMPDNTERVRILSDGKVGIGKNNPSTILDVNGTVTATSFSGNGANITNIPYSSITGLPSTFPPTMTDIYTKTEVNNTFVSKSDGRTFYNVVYLPKVRDNAIVIPNRGYSKCIFYITLLGRFGIYLANGITANASYAPGLIFNSGGIDSYAVYFTSEQANATKYWIYNFDQISTSSSTLPVTIIENWFN